MPPRFVQAQGLTDDTVALAWTAETGADSYRVYRDAAQVADQPGTSYEDGSLQPGSTHTYAVSSVSGGVESALSTPVTATTQAPRNTMPPTQPGVISVPNVTSSTAELDWSNSTDDVRIVGYRILRGPVGAPPSSLDQIATTDGGSSYDAVNLRSGTSYQFGVIALDADNNYSPIRTVNVTTASSSDTTAPAAPTNGGVRTIPFSSSRIDLVWPASTSIDIASYRIYRNGVQVGDVALPHRKTFSDVGLTSGQSYTYTIRAVDWAGNLSAPTNGKTGNTPTTGTVLIPRGPYLQWVTPTSARIVWWTNLPTSSVVEYGPGVFSDIATESVLRTQHMMLIGGLTPGATYQYRVGDGTVASGTYNFSTAQPAGNAFSFAAVGDFGGGGPGETEVADRIAADATQFTLTVGDNVYPDAQDPDFATFYSDYDTRLFKQYAQVINKQSFWPSNGNKEYYGDGAHWKIFALPNNERWYSYDWGDAHVIVLDSEQQLTPGSPQYEFAEADLAANQGKTWRIAVIHRPPYSSTSNNASSQEVQTNFVPLFEQQNVQLVLSGNSHNYERSYPLLGGQPAPRGVTYVVTGGGGNGHNPFTIPQPAWSAFRDGTNYEYMRVSVSPQSLQLAAIRGSDGVTLDSTVIDAPGKIVVRKDARPDQPQDFDFTAGGGLSPSSFQLDDDPDGILANTRTFSNVPPGSGYSVSEAVPSGWEQASATCDDGSAPSNIDVSPGETVTCVFTNDQLSYARPKGASPDNFTLVPAFNACAGANAGHGAPLAVPSCVPQTPVSNFLTMNAPDRPAPFDTAPDGSASVTLKAACLEPNTTIESGEAPPCPSAGDQADVKITSSVTGVRCASVSGGCALAGGTYDGKLLGVFSVRITDRFNGPTQTKAATATDYPMAWGAQCAAGTCGMTTSADALLPGLVLEQKRTIWQLGEMQVLDGGPDGDLAPTGGGCPPTCSGNDGEALFLRQGLFAP